MKKPTPKHEIVVKYHPADFDVWIAVASEDAANWIETEAPPFGKLYKEAGQHWPYTLHISATYDVTEVCQYLARDGKLIERGKAKEKPIAPPPPSDEGQS